MFKINHNVFISICSNLYHNILIWIQREISVEKLKPHNVIKNKNSRAQKIKVSSTFQQK